MTTQSSPSLYDRLGGVYAIATVMDDFIDRIMIFSTISSKHLTSLLYRRPSRRRSRP